MIKKLYEWKPIPTRLAGRPKIRWENDIKEDFKNLNPPPSWPPHFEVSKLHTTHQSAGLLWTHDQRVAEIST